MTISRSLILLAVIMYSCSLLWIEWSTSQVYVRHFFTDIKGDVLFYAVNTTLSAFVLWSIALLFGICLLFVDRAQQPREFFFCLSQIIMFTYLGVDERFLLHENLGRWLHRNDAYLLLGLGFIELSLLAWLGNIRQRSYKAQVFLISAAVLFAIMIFIDAILPSRLLFRLSLEDLTKLWAGLCLAFFAWEILLEKINRLKSIDESNLIR